VEVSEEKLDRDDDEDYGKTVYELEEFPTKMRDN